MTSFSTTRCRFRSFWLDHLYLIEPTGSRYALRGMSKREMRRLQRMIEKDERDLRPGRK